MPPFFYQKHWDIIGDRVTAAVLQALYSGEFPIAPNHTFFTLIPKKKQPSKVAEYRLISLCNVLYKLISKVLANIIKILLPSLISESQSVFVPVRQITDNILIVYEIIHFLRHKRANKASCHLSLI